MTEIDPRVCRCRCHRDGDEDHHECCFSVAAIERDAAEVKFADMMAQRDARTLELLAENERHAATTAKLARCVEAASDVAEGACSFKDSRVSYEEWQINVGSMERLRAAIAGEAMPRGWLIESTLSHGGGPRWWQGKQPGTEEQWTGSHTAAIRFARREDAEACRLTLGDAHVSKVTEHVWL